MPSRQQQALDLIKNQTLVSSFMQEDPSKSNKYLLWMCQQHLKGHTLGDIVGTVQSFNRRRKSLKHQDIYQYSELKDLEREILKLNPSKSEKKYLKNLKEGVDFITLFEQENIGFYAVLTHKGMKNLGAKTRWCVVANHSYWKSYSGYGDFYVLIDSRHQNQNHKIAFHVNHNSGAIHYYDANDSQVDFNKAASPKLIDIFQDKIRVLSKIKGVRLPTKSKKAENNFTFELESETQARTGKKTIQKDADFSDAALLKEIKDKNLWGLLRVSKRKDLIESLKDDYLNKGPGVTLDASNSPAFNEIFQDQFKIEDIMEGLSKSNLTKDQINVYKDKLSTLSDKEFADLINSCNRANVRLHLLKMRPKVWKDLKKENLTITIGTFLIKEYKLEALEKVAHLCNHTKGGYYSYSRKRDNSVLAEVRKLNITSQKAEELLKRNDLSKRMKKLLNTKKRKSLNDKEKQALKDSLGNLIKSGVIPKQVISSKELAKVIKEINS